VAAGLSLSGMAHRTGYSRGYLGNLETGIREVTPEIIRAYEKVLGDDVNRRTLLLGMAASAAAATTTTPDVAVDVVRDISAERSKLLSTVQTTHATDRVIAKLIATDTPGVASLYKWMRRGSPVLRVNSAGILAKICSPAVDDDVIRILSADDETRDLYLTAVVSRVLAMPWDDAKHVATSRRPLKEPDYVERFAQEVQNPADSGARWCSTVMLARTRTEDPQAISRALRDAITTEQSREVLRLIAGTLADINQPRI
jgi:transcriptional regulator with XRE-family HTH domain